MENGEYDLEDGMRMIVQEYRTHPKESCQFEAHRKFVDFQYVVSGDELISIGVDHSTNKIHSEYFEEDDCMLYTNLNENKDFPATQGDFFVFFPEDNHLPGCINNSPSNVRKVVIKIPLYLF